MTLTQNWSIQDYLNYIIKNRLDEVWAGWCNPTSGGIRVAAYKPIYNDSYVQWLDTGNKKCSKKNCNGRFIISEDDKQKRIINRWRCDVCSTKKDVLYRDIDKRDNRGKRKSKLYFSNPETVRFYGMKGRTFYSTLIVYDPQILNPDMQYSDVSLMKSVTLGIDIDLKYGCITDIRNRKELQNAIDFLRNNFLDKIVPNSYTLQTSGKGIYVLLHHKLITKDIFKTCLLYNVWITKMNEYIENDYVKMDALNGPSRVFKLIGSIHQEHDVVAIPLPYDVNLAEINPEQFKLKNFDINNYINKDTGKLEYYNRYDEKDSQALYEFLNKNVAMLPTSSPRAMRAKVRGEIDETKWAEQCAEFMKKEAWILLDIDIPGEVYYRIKDNSLEINMFRIPEEDRDRIRKIIKDKIREQSQQSQRQEFLSAFGD